MGASKSCTDHLSQSAAVAHVLVAFVLACGALFGACAYKIGETESVVASFATLLIEHERTA